MLLEQLREMKQELRKFSRDTIDKHYLIIQQIYKGEIDIDVLIESEITKSLVRIASKPYRDSDEKKYQNSIKMCRKLIKEWKELLKPEDFDIQIKKVKQEQKTNHNGNGSAKPQTQAIDYEDNREKAIKGIKKFLSKRDPSEDYTQIAQDLEKAIFDQTDTLDKYKEKVKALAKHLDQDQQYRDQIIDRQLEPNKAIKQI